MEWLPGETNVYSALGGFIEQRKAFEWGQLNNSYIWRLGVGNYQADSFTSTNLTDTLRSNFYGSLPAAIRSGAASLLLYPRGRLTATHLKRSFQVYSSIPMSTPSSRPTGMAAVKAE